MERILCGADHQAMNQLLPDCRTAGALADEDALRRRREVEHSDIDERVVENDVRLGEAARSLSRQQFGIARPPMLKTRTV